MKIIQNLTFNLYFEELQIVLFTKTGFAKNKLIILSIDTMLHHHLIHILQIA